MAKPTKLIAADYQIQVWHHCPTEPLDALLDPAYWAHVAKSLRPGHRIEVLAEDGSYWAMLIVRSTTNVSALVGVLQHVPLEKVSSEEMAPGFTVKWVSPSRKFGVIRLSDSAMMRDGFDTRDQAEVWVKGHAKAQAA